MSEFEVRLLARGAYTASVSMTDEHEIIVDAQRAKANSWPMQPTN